jgi:hypothetical protein
MKKIRKALVAAGGSAATALVGGFGFALADGDLTGKEVLAAIGLACTAAAAIGSTVWKVPNEAA